MKKNSEYIGVDEKFVPEDEKYVNDSILGNREETKSKLKKVLKIGLGAWLIWALVAIAFFVICVILILNHSKNVNKQIFDMYGGVIDNMMDGTQFQQDLMEQSQQIQQQVDKEFEQQDKFQETQQNILEQSQQSQQTQQNTINEMKDVMSSMSSMMDSFMNN